MDGEEQISCTGVFLATLVLRGATDGRRKALGLETEELSPLWRFSKEADRFWVSKFAGMLARYYTESALTSGYGDSSAPLELSPALEAIFVGLANAGKRSRTAITPGELFRAILVFPESTLSFRLKQAGINQEHLVVLFDSQVAPAAGLRTNMMRELGPGEELTPDVEVYAAALATVLRTAVGEFCFGLFGAWGIGKTRLVTNLAPLVERPERYGKPCSNSASWCQTMHPTSSLTMSYGTAPGNIAARRRHGSFSTRHLRGRR